MATAPDPLTAALPLSEADGPGRSPGRAELVTVAIAVATATLPAVMPAMVGAMAARPGIGTAGAGYLVSANMGGLFAGTVLAAARGRDVAGHRLLRLGLLVMIVGNLLTVAFTSLETLIAMRALSGLGEGVAAAVCFRLMALARRPAVSLALYTAGQAAMGFVGMALLPWLVAVSDWRAFYLAVSVVALPAIVFARAAGGSAEAPDVPGEPRPAVPGSAWVQLLLIFVFFTGMALIWAFLQPVATLHGLALAETSAALSASAIAGLLGAFAAGWLADRLTRTESVLAGAGLLVATAYALTLPSAAAFAAGAWTLNFVWGFQYPFLFRQLASYDPHRGAALTPTATGLGLSAGPAIGGLLLDRAGLAWSLGLFLILSTGPLLLSLALPGRLPARRRAFS